MTAKLLSVALAALTQLHPALTLGFERLAVASAQMPDSRDELDGLATIQVDLLPDDESAALVAASLRRRLATAGLTLPVRVEAVAAEPELPRSHRVVVGPFAEFEDAERARTELDALGVRGFVRELELPVGC